MLRNTCSKSRVTKLCLYADNEIKMEIDNTNKPEQTALKYKSFNTQITQGFWWLVNEGVNRGMEIRRSVLFFGPKPSIRCYFRSNPDPHYVKLYCGIRLLQ